HLRAKLEKGDAFADIEKRGLVSLLQRSARAPNRSEGNPVGRLGQGGGFAIEGYVGRAAVFTIESVTGELDQGRQGKAVTRDRLANPAEPDPVHLLEWSLLEGVPPLHRPVDRGQVVRQLRCLLESVVPGARVERTG